MTFLAGLYPKHENVNEISNGRWKYSYKETHNNICVAVSFERDCLDNSPVKLAYVDLNLDLAKAMTVLNPTMYLDSVISSLHRRNFERAAIFANSKSSDDIDAQWLRVWKNKRCLHLGLPNRAAMLLLTGLTKRITEAEARIAATKTAALANVDEIAADTAQAVVARVTGEATVEEARDAVAIVNRG